jgi:aconitate hydratase
MNDLVSVAKRAYDRLQSRVPKGREALGTPLTLAEKILIGHLPAIGAGDVTLKRRESSVGLRPDRVAMQDATAQMALLQLMHAGLDRVAIPTTVHCDHLIRAHVGAEQDLLTARDENREVYAFLKSASARYGIGFWEPGSGIIHQVVLENYAFPGGMMIGTDSHTPNGGGLGMIAIGIGGADAVDVMADQDFGLRWPGVIGVKLTGRMSGWTGPKDVILKLMSILTVKGGTGHIVEFFGDGARTISATGKGTICNMGAEHGATTSIFPFDDKMKAYLKATDRAALAELAEEHAELLRADPEVEVDPGRYYDRVIEIDLDALEPWIVGPHSPDLARPVSQMAQDADGEGYDTRIRYGLIGSCTNSSYEDIGRAAHLAQQAMDAGLKTAIPLMVTPGSNRVMETIQRAGFMEVFDAVGATVLANACGPCIGQWKRDDIAMGDANTIVSSYNRNFRGRNDQNRETLSFLASPEIVIAYTFSGDLHFNPLTDSLKTPDGKDFKFRPPQGDELPPDGFVSNVQGFVDPPADGTGVEIEVAADSKRLQLLGRFEAWNGKDFLDMPVLLKAKGKTTTDHISAAGPWLRFRGHLDNISDNLFLGAMNAFTGKPGKGKNQRTGETGRPFPEIARDYKAHDVAWVVFGDENYGEGSSREHAAMEPRHLGARAVVVRSFARIAETNLKKQGVLPLVFVDAADYDKIEEDDRISVLGLRDLAPGRTLRVEVNHADGTTDSFEVTHSLDAEQIEWFKAGSALNRIAAPDRVAP